MLVLWLWFCVFWMGCESESGMLVRREIWNEKESATAIDGYCPQCNEDDMSTR